MLSWLICAALAAAPQPTAAWTAPKDASPNKILDEAVADARAGRNDQALAKYLWFYDNALKYDPALSGVRRSFALSYWRDLAKGYPPAMQALTSARDSALREIGKQDAKGVYEPFSDYEAINRVMGEESLTISAFVDLDKDRPEAAARVFHVARSALVRAKEYKLCGKYLQPDRDWEMASRLFTLHGRGAPSPDTKRAEYAEKSFTNATATLVSLLVVNGRREEAETIAEKARHEWDNPKFRAAIDSALTGVVPEQWP